MVERCPRKVKAKSNPVLSAVCCHQPCQRSLQSTVQRPRTQTPPPVHAAADDGVTAASLTGVGWRRKEPRHLEPDRRRRERALQRLRRHTEMVACG
jgi:hypothetical protein